MARGRKREKLGDIFTCNMSEPCLISGTRCAVDIYICNMCGTPNIFVICVELCFNLRFRICNLFDMC
jgi:hypothetical protein